ncbi:MAG: hypothetical protein ACXWZT_08740 [Gaiellaceae bacterium]
MKRTDEPTASRWTGLGAALTRFGLACGGLAVGLGMVAALIALATDHRLSATIAVAYYIVGCLLFLIGTFPTGGFSLIRGTMTKRRPTGFRGEPIFLFGIVLIGLGFIADVYSF